MKSSYFYKYIPFAFLLIGCGLRLLWPSDMEWKGDEKWMHGEAVAISRGETPYPLLGMPSSMGLKNPGLSVWVFAGLAKFSENPVSMGIFIQIINIGCLLFLYLLFSKLKNVEEKRLWQWAIALQSVSPIPIILSRKIWAQCVVLPFVIIAIVGHRYRHQKWGASVWGFFGGLMGQIHLAGFFLQLALFLKTIWQEISEKKKVSDWSYWIGGTVFAVIPCLPWIKELFLFKNPNTKPWLATFNIRIFKYFLTTPWGLEIPYVFNSHFLLFLREPVLQGRPTYLSGLLYGGVGVFALVFILKKILSFKKNLSESTTSSFPLYSYYFGICFWLYGIVLSLSGLSVYVHYLILVFPILFAWIAKPWLKNPKLLVLLALLQLSLSILVMWVVHRDGGAMNYGDTFSTQIK